MNNISTSNASNAINAINAINPTSATNVTSAIKTINSSAREILDDLGTDLHKEKLLTIPGRIEVQKTKIRQLREVYAEKEQLRALKEAEIMSDIVSDVDPGTLKPRYSNDTARNTAKLRKMAIDEEYQKAAREAKDAEMNVNEAQDGLQGLYDEFKAAQCVAEIVASETALFAKMMPITLVRPVDPVELAREAGTGAGLKKAQAY